jgi:hypothetical protein
VNLSYRRSAQKLGRGAFSLFTEIVGVNPLNLVSAGDRHSQVVLNHMLREFSAVDENNLGFDTRRVADRLRGEW